MLLGPEGELERGRRRQGVVQGGIAGCPSFPQHYTLAAAATACWARQGSICSQGRILGQAEGKWGLKNLIQVEYVLSGLM